MDNIEVVLSDGRIRKVRLIGADARSYMRSDTEWTPTLPGTRPGQFTMADLLRFAGVV